MSNSLMIAVTEAKGAVEVAVRKDPAISIEDRLRAAFGATRHHWLVTDEDGRFRAGVGGVLVTASAEEQVRIEAELRMLRTLDAAMSGVPVDIGALNDSQPIGMLAIWRENT